MQMYRLSYRYVTSKESIDEKYREVVRLSQRYVYWGYRKIYELVMEREISISRE